jgi:hypothetical protein
MVNETYEQKMKRLEKKQKTETQKQAIKQGCKITATDVKAYNNIIDKQKHSWRTTAKQKFKKINI